MDPLTERTGTLRWEFRVGVLAWPVVQGVANCGKVYSLDVTVHYSGWLIRHGWVVAHGGEASLKKLGDYIARVEAGLVNNGGEH